MNIPPSHQSALAPAVDEEKDVICWDLLWKYFVFTGVGARSTFPFSFRSCLQDRNGDDDDSDDLALVATTETNVGLYNELDLMVRDAQPISPLALVGFVPSVSRMYHV